MPSVHYICIAFLCAICFAWTLNCPKPKRYDSVRYVNLTSRSLPYPTGTILRMTCRKGYTGKLVQSVMCVNGSWTVPQMCNKRRCSTPKELLHGRYDIPGDLYYGSNITYKCDKGYMLIGKNTSTCLLNEEGQMQWIPKPPLCEIRKCAAPPKILNGRHSNVKDDYSYLDSVKYSCNDKIKLTLIGPSSKYCSETGYWFPEEETKCEFTFCEKPKVANGNIRTGNSAMYLHSQFVSISCNSGYRLNGQTPNVCNKGVWSPAIPTCEEVAPPRGDMPHINTSEDPYTSSGSECACPCGSYTISS
uniref:Complement control protein homolog n=1 Tax=Saimiriine herpesvirus 2 (strain 488) TaxID=10384 RepID=Q80BR0_SHV2C|nr:complement control protein homolog [Saimiriine gammaherpesvirus 2]